MALNVTKPNEEPASSGWFAQLVHRFKMLPDLARVEFQDTSSYETACGKIEGTYSDSSFMALSCEDKSGNATTRFFESGAVPLCIAKCGNTVDHSVEYFQVALENANQLAGSNDDWTCVIHDPSKDATPTIMDRLASALQISQTQVFAVLGGAVLFVLGMSALAWYFLTRGRGHVDSLDNDVEAQKVQKI